MNADDPATDMATTGAPRRDEEATLLHEFDELMRFVSDRTRDQVQLASQAGDELRSSFAIGSLGVLSTMRDTFRGYPIGRGAVVTYLRRTAALHRHHPDFRPHWLM
jgi:hypothetical protein